MLRVGYHPVTCSLCFAAGQQDRRQVAGGARTHHDLSEVQHPEVVPGGGHHTLRSPRRHGRQRLLRPLRQNVSITCKHVQIHPNIINDEKHRGGGHHFSNFFRIAMM